MEVDLAVKKVIALINADTNIVNFLSELEPNKYEVAIFKNAFELHNYWRKTNPDILCVISVSEIMSPLGIPLYETLKQNKFLDIPFILFANHINDNLRLICLQSGIADVYIKLPDNHENFIDRVSFLCKNWELLNQKQDKKVAYTKYKTPLNKRFFDIFFASLALIMLSPIFIIVIILLKLESKGPVFYYSLRAGTGYKVFKFFKFRSMFVNADKKLKELNHLNQYNTNNDDKALSNELSLCDICIKEGTKCQYPIYADKIQWCERSYLNHKHSSGKSAFIKIKNDPRVTKVGNFIRNTSIDELPQLWNVIIGDMSIVGNRPLPLYEAEKLTTDKYALRFLAPAGITGLWQVEKRGKGEMSEEERLLLDNQYAKNHSFANDLKLILKTIPALFQKENV